MCFLVGVICDNIVEVDSILSDYKRNSQIKENNNEETVTYNPKAKWSRYIYSDLGMIKAKDYNFNEDYTLSFIIVDREKWYDRNTTTIEEYINFVKEYLQREKNKEKYIVFVECYN